MSLKDEFRKMINELGTDHGESVAISDVGQK